MDSKNFLTLLKMRGFRVQASPVALFPQTRNFTPLCLSSPSCTYSLPRRRFQRSSYFFPPQGRNTSSPKNACVGGYCTYCLGINMQRTSIPSRRGLAILLGMLHAIKGNRDKLRPFGPLARVRLYLHHLITMNSSKWTQIIINKQDLFKTYNLRI